MHGRGISALRYLSPFLYTTLSENASASRPVTFIVFNFSGHLELFQGRFGKFLLNFLFEVNEFYFYFGVDISFFL